MVEECVLGHGCQKCATAGRGEQRHIIVDMGLLLSLFHATQLSNSSCCSGLQDFLVNLAQQVAG